MRYLINLKESIASTKTSYVLGITIFFMYLLMVMGTFVTSTGSGLACPDWPLCYGTVRPPFKMHIWFEWGHRLLGAITGTLIFTSAIIVWRRYKGAARFLVFTLASLLSIAVILGGITVLIEAPYLDNILRIATVSSHLIIATLVLISLVFLLRRVAKKQWSDMSGYYFMLFGAVYSQVILGILVRYSKASLACPDFPLCQGNIIPYFSDYAVVLHFSHRVMAMIVVLLTILLIRVSIKNGTGIEKSLLTLTIVLTQAVFGASIVLTGMFLPFIILHGATGFILLGWLAYQSAPYIFKNIRISNMEVRGAI